MNSNILRVSVGKNVGYVRQPFQYLKDSKKNGNDIVKVIKCRLRTLFYYLDVLSELTERSLKKETVSFIPFYFLYFRSNSSKSNLISRPGLNSPLDLLRLVHTSCIMDIIESQHLSDFTLTNFHIVRPQVTL